MGHKEVLHIYKIPKQQLSGTCMCGKIHACHLDGCLQLLFTFPYFKHKYNIIEQDSLIIYPVLQHQSSICRSLPQAANRAHTGHGAELAILHPQSINFPILNI